MKRTRGREQGAGGRNPYIGVAELRTYYFSLRDAKGERAMHLEINIFPLSINKFIYSETLVAGELQYLSPLLPAPLPLR